MNADTKDMPLNVVEEADILNALIDRVDTLSDKLKNVYDYEPADLGAMLRERARVNALITRFSQR